MIENIPGIKVDCLKYSEAQLMCRILLSPSDAQELCKHTKSGLILNKDLRDYLFEQITKSLNNSLEIMKGRSNGQAST